MNIPTEQNTATTTTRTLDRASNSIHNAIDGASAAARPAVDQMTASAHNAVDKMTQAACRAAETIEEKTTQLRDAQARLTETCRSQVREKPMAAVGVALAAGFLVSWWLGSRK